MSTASASTPAMSRAFLQALAACWATLSPSPRMCRRLIPVRVVIHSSFVSMYRSRSWLDSTVAGAELPTPVSLQPASPGAPPLAQAATPRALRARSAGAAAYWALAL
jgi:hypothetical protein